MTQEIDGEFQAADAKTKTPPVPPATTTDGDSIQNNLDALLGRIDIRYQVRGVQGPSLLLIQNTLKLLRRLVNRTLFSGRTYGPFDSYLSGRQESSVRLLLESIGKRLDEQPIPADAFSVYAGQLLQVIIDTIAAAVQDDATSNLEREFLVRLADEASVLNSGRSATEADQLEEARRTAQESAGNTAESELAKNFVAYADDESKSSKLWLAGTAVLILLTAALAVKLLNLTTPFSWPSLIGHLLITLPCLGFATYCARESSRHREAARWSTRVAVQLKSISAYSQRIDDESRQQLMSSFGHYIFGPHDYSGENELKSIPPEVLKAAVETFASRASKP